ncbi:MAG TPA: hypothetical protein PLY87_13515 [Planctomycetaceae bacterium]|nr:hypothetical protein [Planctomycetaceae bacterium]
MLISYPERAGKLGSHKREGTQARIGDAESLSFYSYVRSDPVNMMDPTGLAAVTYKQGAINGGSPVGPIAIDVPPSQGWQQGLFDYSLGSSGGYTPPSTEMYAATGTFGSSNDLSRLVNQHVRKFGSASTFPPLFSSLFASDDQVITPIGLNEARLATADAGILNYWDRRVLDAKTGLKSLWVTYTTPARAVYGIGKHIVTGGRDIANDLLYSSTGGNFGFNTSWSATGQLIDSGQTTRLRASAANIPFVSNTHNVVYGTDFLTGDQLNGAERWGSGFGLIGEGALTAAAVKSQYDARLSRTISDDFVSIPDAATVARLQIGADVVVPSGKHGQLGLRNHMSQITLQTRNEVALLRMNDGTRVLRMGGPKSVDVSGARRIIAHTHPSGRLALSDADIAAMQRRAQRSTVIIDPNSDIASRIWR